MALLIDDALWILAVVLFVANIFLEQTHKLRNIKPSLGNAKLHNIFLIAFFSLFFSREVPAGKGHRWLELKSSLAFYAIIKIALLSSQAECAKTASRGGKKSVAKQNVGHSAVNHLTIKPANAEWDIKLSSSIDIIVC